MSLHDILTPLQRRVVVWSQEFDRVVGELTLPVSRENFIHGLHLATTLFDVDLNDLSSRTGYSVKKLAAWAEGKGKSKTYPTPPKRLAVLQAANIIIKEKTSTRDHPVLRQQAYPDELGLF